MSASSSASARDSLADTPAGTDESDYESDTDTAIHNFHAGRHERRGSEVSEDLDAEEPTFSRTTPDAAFAPAPGTALRQHQQPPTRRPQLLSQHDFDTYYFRHDLLVLQNFDILRAADFAFALAMFYCGAAFVMTLLSSRAQLVAILANAVAWRFIHTFVLGGILRAQSEKKWMVRHFLSELARGSSDLAIAHHLMRFTPIRRALPLRGDRVHGGRRGF